MGLWEEVGRVMGGGGWGYGRRSVGFNLMPRLLRERKA